MLVTEGGATAILLEVVQRRVTVGEVSARRGDRREERQPQVMLIAEEGAAAEGHAHPRKEWSPDPIALVAIVVMEGEAASREEGGAARQTDKE
jgi:hypothetical protein